MKKILSLAIALISCLGIFSACEKVADDSTPLVPIPKEENTEPQKLGYDANGANELYYQNAVAQFGSAPVLGDPFLYYDEGDKLFYLYGTTGGRKFDYYISSDLKEWALGGTCFEPTSADWCHSRLWAPEMHKIGDKYWLYYSAGENDGAMLHCSVAVADSPAGPFTNNVAEGVTGAKPRFDFGFPSIDGSIFKDDDGKLYYYFAKDQVQNVSTIWGAELENPYTIKSGTTAKQLTRVGFASMSGSVRREWEGVQGTWNEGPFMVKNNGVYYLTYSANSYTSKYYGVGYATSNSPLGDFEKPEDNMLLGTPKQSDASKEWDYVSGTGHHMFLNIGEQKYVVYHKHYNIKQGGNVRIFTIDGYGFREDGSMFINGSTLSPQPRPSVLSGYKNVMDGASISGAKLTSDEKKMLKDGGIGVYPLNAVKSDVTFAEGKTVITVKFTEPTSVRAVLLYAGSEYDKILKKVDKIEFDDIYYVTDIKLDGNYIDTQRKYMAVGNAISATLYQDVAVSQIKITINSETQFSLSEIAVLGKSEAKN